MCCISSAAYESRHASCRVKRPRSPDTGATLPGPVFRQVSPRLKAPLPSHYGGFPEHQTVCCSVGSHTSLSPHSIDLNTNLRSKEKCKQRTLKKDCKALQSNLNFLPTIERNGRCCLSWCVLRTARNTIRRPAYANVLTLRKVHIPHTAQSITYHSTQYLPSTALTLVVPLSSAWTPNSKGTCLRTD
ncbi:hypothetical protein VTK56DRAFT_305 [Thermocarpiscus australiensis]